MLSECISVLAEPLTRHKAASELGRSFFILTNINVILQNHSGVCATKEIKSTLKHFRGCWGWWWCCLVYVLGPTDREVNKITYLLSEDTESSKRGEQNVLIGTNRSSLRLNGHHWQRGCHHTAVPSSYPKHDQPLFPAPQYPLAPYPCMLAAACSHIEGHLSP